MVILKITMYLDTLHHFFMYKNLPPEFTTTLDLTQKIEKKDFYYNITFTVFGEVIQMENDFDDLPEIAKKLMVGGKKLEVISKEQFSMDEFKYIVPLVAIGSMGKLPNWMQPIKDTIQQLSLIHISEPTRPY